MILPNVDLDYVPANPHSIPKRRYSKFRRQVSIRISRAIIGESASLENFSRQCLAGYQCLPCLQWTPFNVRQRSNLFGCFKYAVRFSKFVREKDNRVGPQLSKICARYRNEKKKKKKIRYSIDSLCYLASIEQQKYKLKLGLVKDWPFVLVIKICLILSA